MVLSIFQKTCSQFHGSAGSSWLLETIIHKHYHRKHPKPNKEYGHRNRNRQRFLQQFDELSTANIPSVNAVSEHALSA